MHPFKKISAIAVAIVLFLIVAGFALTMRVPVTAQAGAVNVENQEVSGIPGAGVIRALAQVETPPAPRVNHREFPLLRREFQSGSEVTAACLTCHSGVAQEVMQTTHWTWEFESPIDGELLGKKNVINNYSMGIASNEPLCTSCHTGFGWEDTSFDFGVQENVDCLVCHDTTGTYQKLPAGAGHPAIDLTEFPPGSETFYGPIDLSFVAQSVGPTSRVSCGSCHFSDTSDPVRHGDLDASLRAPDRNADVHMSLQGGNFSCSTCHTAEAHQIAGSRYTESVGATLTCETCHTSNPHPNTLLNNHSDRVACQTCHIPAYGVGGAPAMTFWDWSKAGGAQERIENDNGYLAYDPRYGEFTWQENVVPQYAWFNGQIDYVTVETIIDPASPPVPLTEIYGDRTDPNAKIFPVRVQRAIQPYDVRFRTLVIPHLYGDDPNAYWNSMDWNQAIRAGMDYVGAEYSGEYGFIETEMYRVENHMVAPREGSLICLDCHTTEDSLLDFAALGYSPVEVNRLTLFPPDLSIMSGVADLSPEYCLSCHVPEHEQWLVSNHGAKNVGCVACHLPADSTSDHPTVPMSVDRSEFTCGTCHLGHLDDWRESRHAELGITCINCHEPHNQNQRIVGDFQTSCESCHHKEAVDVPHSTHTAAGLICTDCHKHTQLSTGHNFEIGPDTCLRCHSSEIHRSSAIIDSNSGLTVTPVSPPETVPIQEPETPAGVIEPPPLFYLIVGGVAGFGLFWVFRGRDPGSIHLENQPDMQENNASEQTKSEDTQGEA